MIKSDMNKWIHSVSTAPDESAVIRALKESVRAIGGTKMFVSGIPMPGRPIEMLVISAEWPNIQNPATGQIAVGPGDPVLELAMVSRWPFVLSSRLDHFDAVKTSFFASDLEEDGKLFIVVVPFHALNPYQGMMVIGGLDHCPSGAELGYLDSVTKAAFQRLADLDAISLERPGGLSPRERRVIELTAFGKTASEIAQVLRISHRTVHAHLQNASGKLDARNKTQTVVEAIRYGQISLSTPPEAQAPTRNYNHG